MKPPVKRPGTSGARSRRNGSGKRKKPKRLSYLSPPVPNERKSLIVSPASTHHSPRFPLSSPSFNLSFGSDINDELFLCVDKVDVNHICSTPAQTRHPYRTTGTTSPNVHLPHNTSASPLFDFSSLQAQEDGKQVSSACAPNLSSFITTPAKNYKEHLKLSQWGLPALVLEQYARRGIISMYEWQAECLMQPGVLQGGNLVFSAPTSGGKTLIAELLALKCVLETRKKAVIILPFVSIAHEKSNYLRSIFESVGVKVGGFMGGQSPPGGFSAIDIAVCTIEKANSLVNKLLEEGSIGQLGAVVVDELHMIADSHRGFLLELLLTKLLYCCKKGKNGGQISNTAVGTGTKSENEGGHQVQCREDGGSGMIQIIGMSATLPNLDTLATWLGGQLYCTDFRPVPLKEMVKIGPSLFDTNLQKIRDLGGPESATSDEEDILQLCEETITNGHSVLIFCPTKQWCENLATTIASASFLHASKALPSVQEDRGGDKENGGGGVGAKFLDSAALSGVLEHLRRTQVGLDAVLKKTVPSGVAFHHAGLTFDEREIVEGAFRQGLIKVLVATSTLSSGVNLPARLVIVRTPFFQRSLLDVLIYKQMVGRAGRKGVDESGESILICKPSEKSKVTSLFQSAPKAVQSCLDQRSGDKNERSNKSALRRALLEVVASGTATSSHDVEVYIKCTLLFAEMSKKFNRSPKPLTNKISPKKNPSSIASSLVQSAIEYLVANEFISLRDPATNVKEQAIGSSPSCPLVEYYATQLGVATVASALSPEEALVVLLELRRACQSFVLENELHIVYLVTPVYIQEQWPTIDWYRFLCLLERLPANFRHVANILGVKESFLASAVQGRIPERTAAQQERLRIHRRFFTALALHDLVHEVPIVHVARKYSASKGLLQTLQSAAGIFAGMVTAFCNRLGWKNLELLLSQFQSRLTFGIERELCDLVRISLLNGFRARTLYNAGFHSLSALATANPLAIELCLRNAVPFKSSHTVKEEGEEGGLRNNCTTWCAKLRKGMTEFEAAKEIVHEAQRILSEDLNIPLETWKMVQSLPPPHLKPDGLAGGAGQAQGPVVERKRLPIRNPNVELVSNNTKKPCLEELKDTTQSIINQVPKGQGCKSSFKTPDQRKCFKTPLRHCQVHCTKLSSPPQKGTSSLVSSSKGNATDTSHISKPMDHTPSQPAPSQFPMPCGIITEEDSISYSPILSPDVISQFHRSRSRSLLCTPPPVEPFEPGSPCNPPSSPGKEIPKLSPADKSFNPSPDFPVTIPNSFPLSMEMSISFSCNTLAMIDAACGGDEEAVGEGAQQTNMSCSLISGAGDEEGKEGKQAQVAESPVAQLNTVETDVMKEDNSSFPPGCKVHPDTPKSNIPDTTHPEPCAQSNTKALIMQAKHCSTATVPSLSAPPPSHQNLKDLSSICSSQVSLSQSGACIIEVTTNTLLFETFLSECLEQKCISFSIATSSVDQGNCIGSRIMQPKAVSGIPIPHRNEQITGLAFCWGSMDIYYLSLCQNSPKDGEEMVPLATRLEAVHKIFQNTRCQQLIAYSIKKHVKTLATVFGMVPLVQALDPTVADWMLNPDGKEKTIHKMVLHYLPEQPVLSEGEDYEDMPLSSLATHASEPSIRASAEALLASLLMSKMRTLLESEDLYRPFLEVEMPSLIILAKMELNGIGFSKEECDSLKQVLQLRLSELEKEAYSFAQRSFSLTSPEDVAQVLFLELKLPSTSDNKQQKSLGPNRRGRRRIQHLSTAKDVLEKLKPLHPLPGVILEWRRVSSTVTKTVFPLFKHAVCHKCLSSIRIHPVYQIHTATGRVATSDPNIQMVPKEYDIGTTTDVVQPSSVIGVLLSESQVLRNACQKDEAEDSDSSTPKSHSCVCMRSVFVPFPGGVFLAADYSQLELRVLAHMSGDHKLQKFLNGTGDVFKMIAGEWLNMPPSAVSAQDRQNAKQVCYGMIYGIGPKALSEQLGIQEEDAAQFMESFKSKYPTMKKFISTTVQSCKENGYIITLLGRKRFLPGIHSQNIHARSQAERQAVNSTIQGSAADLVKTAMVKIDQALLEEFKNAPVCLALDKDKNESGQAIRGAYLVLQLHDELLYEVSVEDLPRVAEIVRHHMENALQLSVKFPVKMKTGASWGSLKEYVS